MEETGAPQADDVQEEGASPIEALFQDPPVLVEIRYPRSEVESAWHLVQSEEELDRIMDELEPQVEVHASSVWDLRYPKDHVCVRIEDAEESEE